MLIARIWDAINDPMMGVIADRTRSRWGSYRPWAFFATIPMGIFLVLTFTNVGLTGTAKVIYCAVMYICFGMSNTASLIPLGSMANVMTDDNQERAVLGSFREFGSSIGNLAGSIAVPAIVTASSIPVWGKQKAISSLLLFFLFCASYFWQSPSLPRKKELYLPPRKAIF